MHAFLHWVNVEYWSVSWPNITAPSLWTLLGMAVSHVHMTRLQHKHHGDLVTLLEDKL